MTLTGIAKAVKRCYIGEIEQRRRIMNAMMKQAEIDAVELGISPSEALVLAFAAKAALAKMGRNHEAVQQPAI